MKDPVFGLLGSGEFEPWAAEVDRWLLERARTGDGRVLILPTASAPEGEDVFDTWSAKGLAHYEGLGIPAEVVPLRTREDAGDHGLVGRLEGASMVFFSGGNPAYLAATLHDTAFWRTVLDGMGRGLAYGGCSGGVASLTEIAPDSAAGEFGDELWKPGLRLFVNARFGPHWDMLDVWVPGLRDFIVAGVPEDERLVGIDENTAMVGDGTKWSVVGSGGVHLRAGGAWQDHLPGTSFTLPLLGQEWRDSGT